MKSKNKVKYLAGKTNGMCSWQEKHSDTGHLYNAEEIFPKNICPIMFHTLYPYFLGAIFGAKYNYNEKGDCHVCCQAEKSVDVVVKTRPNDGTYGDMATPDRRKVFYAEVVKVNGHCPYNHQVGEKLVFPVSNKTKYACSGGINNIFPFLKIEIPSCINMKRLRCPDWLENTYYSIDEEDLKPDKKEKE